MSPVRDPIAIECSTGPDRILQAKGHERADGDRSKERNRSEPME
jgi:hypothetical protein